MTTPTQPEQTKNGPAPAIGKSATPVKKARVAKRRAQVAPPKAKPAPTAAKRSGSPAKIAGMAKQRAAGATAKPKQVRKSTRTKQAATTRRGSKTAKILDLLKRPGGVTLKKLISATAWQPHSVRGFLSTLGKKKIPVESFINADGERAYRSSK